jgi:hypothetical protein
MKEQRGFGRYGFVTEREAVRIKEYNKRYIQKAAAERLEIKHSIEDILMAREMGITIEELNANRMASK